MTQALSYGTVAQRQRSTIGYFRHTFASLVMELSQQVIQTGKLTHQTDKQILGLRLETHQLLASAVSAFIESFYATSTVSPSST